METKNLVIGLAGIAILGGGYLVYKKNIDAAAKLAADKLIKDKATAEAAAANAAKKVADNAANAERQDLYKQIYAQLVVLAPSVVDKINKAKEYKKVVTQYSTSHPMNSDYGTANDYGYTVNDYGATTETDKIVKGSYSNDKMGYNAWAYDMNAMLMPTLEKMSIDELKLILAYYKNTDIVNDPFQYAIYVNLFKKYNISS